MNKNLIALLVAAALSGAASGQSNVSVFGIIDASVRNVHNGNAGSLWSVSTDGMTQSRLGFRGVEDLGGGLRAGFWLESALAADTGTATPQRFWHRRST